MITYLLFILGFIVLVKGADFLVGASTSLARRFGISELIMGLTIVAFGTSLPELFVSVTASLQGKTDLAIGNILGSNIANILLILGISAIVYPLEIRRQTTRREIPLSLLAVVLLGILANDKLGGGQLPNIISRADGLILLAFALVFLTYIHSIASGSREKFGTKPPQKEHSVSRAVGFIFCGLVLLVLGGKWVVDGAVALANVIGVSQRFIGLAVVAVGTSLPELATSAVAAYRKNSDIAVGNIIGSNIFNIFWILGISAAISPLAYNAQANFDVLATTLATTLLLVWAFVGRRHALRRWQGIAFVILYFSYIAYSVYRG